MTVVAVIPARGGSKRLPRKNMALIAGVPLIGHTINHALEAKTIDAVVVSTDDIEIAEYSGARGVHVVNRPAYLATDTAAVGPVLVHVLTATAAKIEEPEVVVLLQPTSPLRRPEDIDWCVNRLLESTVDSVISVTKAPGQYIWSVGHAGRMREEKNMYLENGAVWAVRTSVILSTQNVYGDIALAYVMPKEQSLDIDTPQDLAVAKMLMEIDHGIQPN